MWRRCRIGHETRRTSIGAATMRWIGYLAALAATSCERSSCSVDSFFCAPPENWAYEASLLDTRRVLELYMIDTKLARPATHDLLPVLGERGEEVAIELVRYLNRNPQDRNILWYGPIIDALYERSGFNICASRYFGALDGVLSQSDNGRYNASSERSALRQACLSLDARPPLRRPA